MKKLKHNRDLKEEKMRLRIRQLELEKELRLSWSDLKESLQPKTFLKNKLANITHTEIKEKDIFSTALSYGAAYLTRQLVNTAGEKIETGVLQGVERISKKVSGIFRRKK